MRPSNKAVFARTQVLKCVVIHGATAPPREVIEQLRTRWSPQDRRQFDEDCAKHAQALISAMLKFGLWKHASPKEQAFLRSSGFSMDPYARMAAGWRMECVGALMWALNLLPEYPRIDIETNMNLLKRLELTKVGILSKSPSLRPHSDLMAARDLTELWHWRVRTRRLVEEGRAFEPTADMKKAGLHTFDYIVRMSARAAYERGDLAELIEDDFIFKSKPFRALTQEDYHVATSIIMERHLALNWVCGMAPGNRWDETPTVT